MAGTDIFSSSPGHPSHHRTRLPPKSTTTTSVFPTRKSLKRTASTASLLTPPVSPEKDKTKPRTVVRDPFSDSEDEELEQELGTPKRIKDMRLVDKERRAQRRYGPPIESPDGEQVVRMRLDSDSPIFPTTPKMNSSFPLAPSTPTPTRRKTRAAMRDSPNNPFLGGSPRVPNPDIVPLEDRPTMTYVFRGVKTTFRNAMFGGVEAQQHRREKAKLDPQDPNFSPDLITTPKLLFPSAPIEEDDEDYVPLRRSPRQIPSKRPSSSSSPVKPVSRSKTSGMVATAVEKNGPQAKKRKISRMKATGPKKA